MKAFSRALPGAIAIAVAGGICIGATSEAIAQFTQQGTKLIGTGANGPPGQGVSVALSANGNTAIVGGFEDNSAVGAAWIFVRKNGAWTQQGNKLVGTPAASFSRQGQSVALSADGNTAIVGAPEYSSDAGAAWVFVRTSGVWTQQGGPLNNAAGFSRQGAGVALSADGNTALVSGGGVFIRNKNGVWKLQKALGSGEAAVALSADGNTALLGGQSGAVVYVRTNGVWKQQGAKLVGTGAVGDARQGTSVALSDDGNTAIIGGPSDNASSGIGVGAAWIFTRNKGVWKQQGNKLVGAGYANPATQGFSVALSGDGNVALLGGYRDNAANGMIGAVWVFGRLNGVWKQEGKKLVGTDGFTQGFSVALSADGNTALSGGRYDNTYNGATWVFIKKPIITAVTPTRGPIGGNTKVTITGKNLAGATAVTFGATRARFSVDSSTQITAYTPRHPKGVVAVAVTTSTGVGLKNRAYQFTP